MKNKTCENCKHRVGIFCYRYPPTVTKLPYESAYPVVLEIKVMQDFDTTSEYSTACGEYKNDKD